MRNLKIEVNGDEVTLRFSLQDTVGMSATGKNMLVASTGGNVPCPGNEDVRIGLNVFRPPTLEEISQFEADRRRSERRPPRRRS
jgi:hypothetical protein